MLRVVTPPAPIVAPQDIVGVTVGDQTVTDLIAAATEEIDGPTGWLGRSLGPQTLELAVSCWGDRSIRLPCPPIIKVESVAYIDATGATQSVDAAMYAVNGNLLWFRPQWSAPALGCDPYPIKVTYKAGYNGASGAGAGEVQTGAVPERARQAIILMVQDARRIGQSGGMVRSEAIEDIRSISYVDGDRVSELTCKAAERLLSGLRIFAL